MRYQRRILAGEIWFCELDADGELVGAAREMSDLGAQYADDEVVEALASSGRLTTPSTPSKIVCVGLNYRQHAEEMGKPIPEAPLLFLKPATAAIAHGDTILLPPDARDVHHEGELAIIIGRRARHVQPEEADDFIAGYTTLNDVTARDIQRREGKYTRAKGYDTFAPFGPTVSTDVRPKDLALQVTVDGEVRQASGCDDLIFDVPTLVAFISRIMTLLPGDVISTGTPSGVGTIVSGQTVEVTLSGVGRLSNSVARDEAAAD